MLELNTKVSQIAIFFLKRILLTDILKIDYKGTRDRCQYIAKFWSKHDGVLDQGNRSRDDKKCSDSEYILKVETYEFFRILRGVKRERGQVNL